VQVLGPKFIDPFQTFHAKNTYVWRGNGPIRYVYPQLSAFAGINKYNDFSFF